MLTINYNFIDVCSFICSFNVDENVLLFEFVIQYDISLIRCESFATTQAQKEQRHYWFCSYYSRVSIFAASSGSITNAVPVYATVGSSQETTMNFDAFESTSIISTELRYFQL